MALIYGRPHIPKKVNDEDMLRKIIEMPVGSTYKAIGKELGISGNSVKKRLNTVSYLKFCYDTMHSKKAVEREKKRQILEAIIDMRENSCINDISYYSELSKSEVKKYLRKYGELRAVYKAFHSSASKTCKKFYENAKCAIENVPIGSSRTRIHRETGIFIYPYLERFFELRDLYERLHAEPLHEHEIIKPADINGKRRKGITEWHIRKAIRELPKFSTITDIAKYLNVGHTAIVYHLNNNKFLRDLYEHYHSNKAKIKEIKALMILAIINARKNSPIKEISNLSGIPAVIITNYMKKYPEIKAVYKSFHPGRKACEKILNKLENIILSMPKGSSLNEIKKLYGINLNEFFDIRGVREFYEYIHGKIDFGADRTVSFLDVLRAINNAPKGSNKAQIARMLSINKTTFYNYLKKDKFLNYAFENRHCQNFKIKSAAC